MLALRMRMMGNYEATLSEVEKDFMLISEMIKTYLKENK